MFDISGFIFLNLVGIILSSVTGSILVFSDDRKVFNREYLGGLYGISSYYCAKSFSEFPIFFIAVNIYIGILYPVVGLNDTFSLKYYQYGKKA